ncbi:hypothetical protein M427DRAFT_223758 [Gonapodya prolifera JEL478]|uniref:PROP1-like PPR domain-containing protein n=1 Tax=Gonapodya prolifera (strain JEL478) TaxID=1344416 RepID=A0A139AN61_GONPJ|nr:hypothetical protein M427DRAFT_223758 [Gonapodya prolifera JEL478]|eukprot:KXS18192.1 hypothetical protein M427DRAFT_223758 [Gonapodya prolifera JEL478]
MIHDVSPCGPFVTLQLMELASLAESLILAASQTPDTHLLSSSSNPLPSLGQQDIVLPSLGQQQDGDIVQPLGQQDGTIVQPLGQQQVHPDDSARPSTPVVNPDERSPPSRLSPAVADRIRASVDLALRNPLIISLPFLVHNLTHLADHLSRVRTPTPLDEDNFAGIIRAHARLGNPAAAQHAFDLMYHAGLTPNLPAFNALLHAYSLAGDVRSTARTFRLLRAAGVEPDVVSYCCLIRSCVESERDKLPAAFALYDEMKRRGVHPDLATFTTLIAGCVRAGNHTRAWRTFDHARTDAGLHPDTHMYTTMIASCAKTRDPERALDLYTEMTTERGLVPTLQTYNALLLALTTASRGSALRGEIPAIRARMQLEGIRPDERTMDAVLNAASRAGDLIEARAVWNESVRIGQADGFLFGNMVRAYANTVGDWMVDVQKRTREAERDWRAWDARRRRRASGGGDGGEAQAGADAVEPLFRDWLESRRLSDVAPFPALPRTTVASRKQNESDDEDDDDLDVDVGSFDGVSFERRRLSGREVRVVSLDDLDEAALRDAEDLVRVAALEREPARHVDQEHLSVASVADDDDPAPAPILSFPPLPPPDPLDDRPDLIQYPLLERPVQDEHDAMAEAQALFEWALRTWEHDQGVFSEAKEVTGVVESEPRQDGVEVECRPEETDRDGGLEHGADISAEASEPSATNREKQRKTHKSKEYMGPDADADLNPDPNTIVPDGSLAVLEGGSVPPLPPLHPPAHPPKRTPPVLSPGTLNAYLSLHLRYLPTRPQVPRMSADLHTRLRFKPSAKTRFLVLDAIVQEPELLKDQGESYWEELLAWDGAEEAKMLSLNEDRREQMRVRQGRGRDQWYDAWCKFINGWARVGDQDRAIASLESLHAFRRPYYLPSPRLHHLTALHRLCNDLSMDGQSRDLQRLLHLTEQGPLDTLEEVQRHLRRNWVGVGWWGWDAIGVGKKELQNMERRAKSVQTRDQRQRDWGDLAVKVDSRGRSGSRTG